MLKLILHTLLVLSMFFSSVGIGVYKHYCHKQLAATTLFVKVDDCCGGKKMPPDCCRDEFELHQLDEDYDGSEAFLLIPIKVPSAPFPSPKLLPTVEDRPRNRFGLYQYRPPLIHPDIPVWNQSFLI